MVLIQLVKFVTIYFRLFQISGYFFQGGYLGILINRNFRLQDFTDHVCSKHSYLIIFLG